MSLSLDALRTAKANKKYVPPMTSSYTFKGRFVDFEQVFQSDQVDYNKANFTIPSEVGSLVSGLLKQWFPDSQLPELDRERPDIVYRNCLDTNTGDLDLYLLKCGLKKIDNLAKKSLVNSTALYQVVGSFVSYDIPAKDNKPAARGVSFQVLAIHNLSETS